MDGGLIIHACNGLLLFKEKGWIADRTTWLNLKITVLSGKKICMSGYYIILKRNINYGGIIYFAFT